MPSLLVTIFLLELVVYLINTIGASAINDLLWTLLNLFPTAHSKEFAEQRKLQKEFLACRRDLHATSSQDEFAKWAKLRRRHDSLLEQLEKKKTTLSASRATFDRYVTAIRWIGTRGLQFFLPFWYAKEPMFWLPYGWFPYYAEWLLSFPRAPLGSVSIASWQLACTGVVQLAGETIVAVVGLVAGSRSGGKQKVPVKSGSAPAVAGEKATAEAVDEKKGS